MKIAILGYYGVPNLGDEAILAGMLHRMRSVLPDAQIRVSARDEDYVRQMHNVETFPLDRMPSFLSVASESDVVLIGGGGLLFDTPFQVLPFWLGRIVAARSVGTPSVLYSVGVGPIEKRRSRRYLKLGLAYADIITVRDKFSAGLLKDCGVKQEVSILPHPALFLQPASESRAKEILREEDIPEDGRRKIGISLRYWQAFDESQQKQFALNIRKALEKIAGSADVSFVMVPFQLPPALGDVGLLGQIATGSACKDHIHVIKGSYSPAEIKAVMGQTDVVLGMRLHSLIFSLTMGVPSVAIAYSRKVTSLMEAYALPEWCIPLASANADVIARLVKEALQREGYGDRLRETSAKIVQESSELHDNVLARLDELMRS